MKRALLPVTLSLIGLAGCGSTPEPAAPAKPVAAPAPKEVPDHTSLFPDKGKVATRIVPDHILDMKKLPGGSVADYDVKGTKYQMFIVDADSNQNAAFMMLDMRDEMQSKPEYIAYMGGYFGSYGDKPFYCFAKLHYLAGVVGLPKAKADPLMRDLAAQLH
jgi:hypothetical protein